MGSSGVGVNSSEGDPFDVSFGDFSVPFFDLLFNSVDSDLKSDDYGSV